MYAYGKFALVSTGPSLDEFDVIGIAGKVLKNNNKCTFCIKPFLFLSGL